MMQSIPVTNQCCTVVCETEPEAGGPISRLPLGAWTADARVSRSAVNDAPGLPRGCSHIVRKSKALSQHALQRRWCAGLRKVRSGGSCLLPCQIKLLARRSAGGGTARHTGLALTTPQVSGFRFPQPLVLDPSPIAHANMTAGNTGEAGLLAVWLLPLTDNDTSFEWSVVAWAVAFTAVNRVTAFLVPRCGFATG